MRWRKLGPLFNADGSQPWLHTHASNPIAEKIDNDVVRVYFSSRDIKIRSHVNWVDVALSPRLNVLRVSEASVLEPGERGLFDDSGVTCCSIVEFNGEKLLYYLGWNLGLTVPYRNAIGLARWDKSQERFVKHGLAPVMDRNDVDPFSLSYPFVLNEGKSLRMWYGSNLRWGTEHDEMYFVLKTALSLDGVNWERSGRIAIDHQHANEHAIARPHVIFENGIFKMWYSYRGNGNIKTYRIGYAESQDGESWKRMDGEAGIDISTEGWDSEMICYPFIFDHGGARYMLYNGNGYGRTGFGIAVLES